MSPGISRCSTRSKTLPYEPRCIRMEEQPFGLVIRIFNDKVGIPGQQLQGDRSREPMRADCPPAPLVQMRDRHTAYEPVGNLCKRFRALLGLGHCSLPSAPAHIG